MYAIVIILKIIEVLHSSAQMYAVIMSDQLAQPSLHRVRQKKTCEVHQYELYFDSFAS